MRLNSLSAFLFFFLSKQSNRIKINAMKNYSFIFNDLFIAYFSCKGFICQLLSCELIPVLLPSISFSRNTNFICPFLFAFFSHAPKHFLFIFHSVNFSRLSCTFLEIFHFAGLHISFAISILLMETQLSQNKPCRVFVLNFNTHHTPFDICRNVRCILIQFLYIS